MATTNGTKAIKENVEALRKAYEVDTDSLFTHLDKMESAAAASTDPVERSVYYSYLAKIYQDYYNKERFFIDDRTDIEGPAPEDRNEWTKQNFYDAVRRYVELSIKEKDALLKAEIGEYKELLDAGKDSLLRPTMYDILMHRAMEVLEYDTAFVFKCYDDLIEAHKDEPLVRDAARLDYTLARINATNNRDAYDTGFAEQYKGSDLYVYARALEIEHNIYDPMQRHAACEEIIEQYPDNPYIGAVKHLLYEVERRTIAINNSDGLASTILYPGKDETFTIAYRNVDSVKLEILRVDMDAADYARTGSYTIKEKHLKPYCSDIVSLPQAGDYAEHSMPYVIKGLKCGIYMIRISDTKYPKDLSANKIFHVTRFMACNHQIPGGGGEVYVVDRLSGEPQKGVKLNCMNEKGRTLTIQSDAMGIAVIPAAFGSRAFYTLESGADEFHPEGGLYFYSHGYKERKNYHVSYFLDRGVYRPGQKVMAKGILYTQEGNSYELVPETDVKVALMDANESEISSQTVKTNEYGSFYAEFDIPTGLLSGNFSIYCTYGSHYFKVEEYKRPTFEVSIDSVKANTVSDPISVKGLSKYYRGVGTGEAQVSYTVSSCPVYYFYCPWALPQIKSHVASGETVCDPDGCFDFQFTPEIAIENTHPFYRLNITVNVTDGSGETQSATYSLVIGETSFSLAFPISGLTDRDKLTDIAPKAYDTAGNSINVSGEYTISDIGAKESKEAKTGTFITGQNIDLSKLKSGKYKIVLNAKDDKGRDVRFESTFTLYSVSDRKPAEEALIWMIPVITECASGDKAEFVLGSSYDSHILMEIYDQNTLVERSIVDVNSACKRIKVEYKASYSDRLYVKLLAVKNGKGESKELTLSRIQKPRNLKLELTHMRSIYAPGDKDRWSVKITDVDGNPVTAELLASMYDLSLDAICGNNWSFDPVRITYKNAGNWDVDAYDSAIYCNNCYYVRSCAGYAFSYPSLSMLGFDIYYSRYRPYGVRKAMALGAVANDSYEAEMDALPEEEEEPMLMAESAPAPMPEEVAVTPRSNFAETAFFYPQINAEDGSAVIEFTAPEALTSWKIMLLAHNKEIQTALLTDTIITQKTLSVNPNLPRFVRTSDSLTLAATIDRLVAEIGDVDVKWRVEDALTGKVISNTNAVKVPMEASLLKVTVTAKGGNYTDGVEALIPVLSSQTLVTESMPIVISTEGEFNFNFESMANNHSETLVSRSYKVSVTPDAATLALQSLPYVGEPKYENAVDYTLAYYINWLSNKAVSENVHLAAYLRRLKEGTQDVKSPLADNEELKNILLQESPWVMDAKFETERNRSLVELLDYKAQEGKRDALLKKLFKLQRSDGGFSWFEGGKSSPYVTLFVAEQLTKAGNSGSQVKKAVKYLVSEMEKEYNDAVKAGRTPHATVFEMRVMMLAGNLKSESSGYYYKEVKAKWADYTLPEQAVAAQLLNAYGDNAEAKNIINNIRNLSVYKPTLGLYWPNTSNIYTHSEYIKAFAAVDPNAEELAKMKMWLLFHKQTNMWGNSVATTDAIDALILAGDKVTGADSHIIVKVGGVTLDSDSAQWAAAVECNFTQPDVKRELADVKVTKSGKALTLGAAYWQYTEDIDKVQKHTDSRLTLKKEYYVEKEGVLRPADSVKVGDIVTVRLVVSADRSMEFIHLRDLRPAGLEPVRQTSGYEIMSGLFYYETSKDCSTDFFFDYMPKGTYVFEYQLKANGAGNFAAGFATIESMYADEFKSQSEGLRMIIK